jgi:hypothetical protein
MLYFLHLMPYFHYHLMPYFLYVGRMFGSGRKWRDTRENWDERANLENTSNK